MRSTYPLAQEPMEITQRGSGIWSYTAESEQRSLKPLADHAPQALIVLTLPQCRGHLVRQCTGDDHDITLPGTGSEHDTESILVVSSGGHVHHLDGAACETESHWPHRSLSCPVDHLVQRRKNVFCMNQLVTYQQHGWELGLTGAIAWCLEAELVGTLLSDPSDGVGDGRSGIGGVDR